MDADAFLSAFAAWAEARGDVKALVLLGSRARTDMPADRWSDVDLVLVVDEPDPYLADGKWLRSFGRPLLTFVEPTAVGGAFERRVLYEDGFDVDVAVVTPVWLQHAAAQPETAGVVKRGARVLVDKVGVADQLAEASSVPAERAPPSEAELDELTSDFWYHAVWAARKLARGEVLMAKRSVDGYLKERLLTLLAWHAVSTGPAVDTWHQARFFESWADPQAVETMREAYARYDRDDVARALRATMDIFERFERETAANLGLPALPDRGRVRGLVDDALGA